MMHRAVLEIWLLPRNTAIAVMHVYRRLVSPLYGEVCRYHPSCSRYSLEAYQQRGFLVGLVLTIWRLLRCNPLTRGGIDDVSPGLRQYLIINTRGFVRPLRKA